MTDYRKLALECMEEAGLPLAFDTWDVSLVILTELVRLAVERDRQERGEPVAWMHDGEGRYDVCHRVAKDLWLNAWPKQVEHYTIPLYLRCHDASWWALVMGAAAALEDAAHCLQDQDAKKAAAGSAKHYRDEASQQYYVYLNPSPISPPAEPEGWQQVGEFARSRFGDYLELEWEPTYKASLGDRIFVLAAPKKG
jgi:hypothetical protein